VNYATPIPKPPLRNCFATPEISFISAACGGAARIWPRKITPAVYPSCAKGGKIPINHSGRRRSQPRAFAAIAQTRTAALRSDVNSMHTCKPNFNRAAPRSLWEQMSPLLDEALASLAKARRGKPCCCASFLLKTVFGGSWKQLGTGEDTRRKRSPARWKSLHRVFNKPA